MKKLVKEMIERRIEALRCKVSTKVLLTKQRVTPGAKTLTICMLGEKGFISLRRIKEIKTKALEIEGTLMMK